jgi:hypothetical protein
MPENMVGSVLNRAFHSGSEIVRVMLKSLSVRPETS